MQESGEENLGRGRGWSWFGGQDRAAEGRDPGMPSKDGALRDGAGGVARTEALDGEAALTCSRDGVRWCRALVFILGPGREAEWSAWAGSLGGSGPGRGSCKLPSG